MADTILIVKDKVQRILAANFNVGLDPDGDFTLRHDSARVFIATELQGDGEEKRVLIHVFALMVMGVPESPALFEHIALHADDYVFGHMAAARTEKGITVKFTHTLLGDYLDEQELVQTVVAVASVANRLDDELKAAFGGERFHED